MTTRSQSIPFGEWLPDLPETNNPGALIAKNVIPQMGSYRGLNSLLSFTSALTSVCLGTFWAQDETNVVFNFCGDASNLYRLDGGTTWTDVSGTGSPYGATNWEFTKFGDRVIAASKAATLQYYDITAGPTFVNLPGAPSAKTVATVRDFVMCGDITGLGGNWIQWSGFNNSELWTPSLATQADTQELFGRAGRVQRIVPGEYGIIFCEHSIFRADYAGPPIVFQIDEIARKRGTPSPNSVAWTGGMVFYFGWDGFYLFDGKTSTPISHNRISNWFARHAATGAFADIRSAVDRINRLVIWSFKSSTSKPINDMLIIYNWGADKWSYAELDTEVIDEFVSPGFSLDALDTVLPGGIDTDSIPVDSTAFAGGVLNLQAFDATHKAATFDGAALAATIDTKEIEGSENRRLVTNSVRPMIESATAAVVTVQVGTRNRTQDITTWSIPRPLNNLNGEASLRVNSRYQRFRLNVTNGFEHGNGVKANSRESGGRR